MADTGEANWHLNTFNFKEEKDNEGFNFFGIVDPDKERLSKIGSRLNLPSTMLFSDVEQCQTNRDVTAIHIATPS